MWAVRVWLFVGRWGIGSWCVLERVLGSAPRLAPVGIGPGERFGHQPLEQGARHRLRNSKPVAQCARDSIESFGVFSGRGIRDFGKPQKRKGHGNSPEEVREQHAPAAIALPPLLPTRMAGKEGPRRVAATQ